MWLGSLITLLAPLSYFLLFTRWPVTRDFPWASYLLFGVGLGLLVGGVRRAYRQPERYGGKVAGSVMAVLGVALLGLFALSTTYLSKQLPASKGAPQVGEKAPDFSLPDKDGTMVTMSGLLHSPFSIASGEQRKPNGALLIFYRGYW